MISTPLSRPKSPKRPKRPEDLKATLDLLHAKLPLNFSLISFFCCSPRLYVTRPDSIAIIGASESQPTRFYFYNNEKFFVLFLESTDLICSFLTLN